MEHEVESRVPNGIVLLMDSEEGELPDALDPGPVTRTPTCVALLTRSAWDGPTTFRVVAAPPPDGTAGQQVFDGLVRTPSGRLALLSAYNLELTAISVTSEDTRLRVWTNDPIEPDRITLLAEAASERDEGGPREHLGRRVSGWLSRMLRRRR